MIDLFSKKYKESRTKKHVQLCENHIYVLQPPSITDRISEEEFTDILKELTDSNLTVIDSKSFINNTLPRVALIDKYGIELIHHLTKEIEKLEQKVLDNREINS